jgi:hypothetical protein
VNLLVAAALAVVAAVVWLPAGPAVLAASVAAIALRGYLVPGTPTLTKRYLPARVLAWFGKAPPDDTGAAEVDVGAALLAAGVVREGGDDLVLAPDARSAWRERITTLRERDVGPDDVRSVLTGVEDLDLESHGDAWLARAEGRSVGRWESRAALLADVAGARLLSERLPEWDAAGPMARAEYLGGLRLFLERCPACDGPVSFGTETVTSCCAEREVVAVRCEDCGARLFESDAPQ